MLSTFLSQLQTYFSKYFVVGSFLPMLAFAFANGLMAYLLFPQFRAWAEANILGSAGRGSFVTTSVLVTIALAAYVLSALSTFLRRQLEGAWWSGVARLFIPAQNRRRERIVNDLNAAAMDMADLDYAPTWEKDLREAQSLGRRKAPDKPFQSPDPDAWEGELQRLEAFHGRYEIVPADRLERCANELARRFQTCDIDHSPYLAHQHVRLGALIDYARERARARHARLQNELNSNFGTQELAPTKMGNVANTIQSYALRRYHCNLEAVWSNLQRVVQTQDKAHASLQEAKAQLDFLVACSWLTLLWAAVWTFVLGWIEPTREGFLAVALGGPAIAYMWYRAAAEQYRSFADIAMTSFDAFRFDLLRDMRLRMPADVEEERHVWKNLDYLTTFGEDRNFRYEPPKQA